MKAVILRNIGEVSQLEIQEIKTPTPNKDEVLIKMQAFSINPIEVKTRKGNRFSEKLLNNPPSILGWDGAGTVEEVGSEIKEFSVGDRVFGVIRFPNFGKTYAEYFVAKEKDLVKIPDNIDFESASVSTIAALTAWQALKHTAQLSPGKKLLIHAASGGVGHFGVQIAHHLGAEIWATASKEKHNFVKSLGADHCIDYKTQNFEEVVSSMDVVFDLIGGDYIDRSLKTLNPGGMIISIPSATNAEVVEKATSKGFKGVRFIMKSDKNDLQTIADLLAKGILKPHISKTFTLDQIREAHLALESGHTTGKIAVVNG